MYFHSQCRSGGENTRKMNFYLYRHNKKSKIKNFLYSYTSARRLTVFPSRKRTSSNSGSRKGTIKSQSAAKNEKFLRCEFGHEVSENNFISNLPTPKVINNLADFYLIADQLCCKVCKKRGKVKAISKFFY